MSLSGYADIDHCILQHLGAVDDMPALCCVNHHNHALIIANEWYQAVLTVLTCTDVITGHYTLTELLFIKACIMNNKLAIHLVDHYHVNIHLHNNVAIVHCLRHGLSSAQWIYHLDQQDLSTAIFPPPGTDITLGIKLAKFVVDGVPVDFTWDILGRACRLGHLDVLQWLESLYTLRSYNHLLENACEFGHLATAQYIIGKMDTPHDCSDIFTEVCNSGH